MSTDTPVTMAYEVPHNFDGPCDRDMYILPGKSAIDSHIYVIFAIVSCIIIYKISVTNYKFNGIIIK
jgi:hypothetical protein